MQISNNYCPSSRQAAWIPPQSESLLCSDRPWQRAQLRKTAFADPQVITLSPHLSCLATGVCVFYRLLSTNYVHGLLYTE